MNIELVGEDIPNERSGKVVSSLSAISEDADRDLVSVNSIGMPTNVLVSTTTSNLFDDQDALKTARIIIHSPASLDVLKNAQQTITFNHLNRSLSVPEKNNNWDPSVYDTVLPVRCRNIRGELHKSRFGSGNKGRSILVNDSWYTPSEFESLCGRGNSKDWKRSIRYGGRTLQCLIDQGILRPHATSCTCSACCEDNITADDGTLDATSGPVRLFTPYKRRKRKNHPKLKVSTNVPILQKENIVSAPAEIHSETIATSLSPTIATTLTIPLMPVTSTVANASTSDSVIVTPEAKSLLPRCNSSVDIIEQKQWWQLEEIVKNLVRQALDLQKQVHTLVNQCTVSKDNALQELKMQMENEKKEALNACRLEAQVALSRALLGAKAEKELAVQDALEQARVEMQEKLHSFVSGKELCANCNREAFSNCTGCNRVSYCSAFCQRKDWQVHKDDCGDASLDADCSELIDTCDASSN